MAFVSARLLTPDRDGVEGYVNVSVNGVPSSILLTGEILDDQLGSMITTVEIAGAEFAKLLPSTPGHEDTPNDPRWQQIMGLVLKKVKALHAQWVTNAASAPVSIPKPPAAMAVIPQITPAMLESV